MTAKSSRMWARKVHEKIMDGDGIERREWIVRVPFCAMECINIARYLLGDNTLGIERLNKPRKNYDMFL